MQKAPSQGALNNPQVAKRHFEKGFNTLRGVPDLLQGFQSTLQGVPSTLQGVPSTLQGVPNTLQGVPSTLRGVPSTLRGVPSTLQGVPSTLQGVPSTLQGVPSTLQGVPSILFSPHKTKINSHLRNSSSFHTLTADGLWHGIWEVKRKPSSQRSYLSSNQRVNPHEVTHHCTCVDRFIVLSF